MTPEAFKAACAAKEVCSVNNLYIFKRTSNVTHKPEYRDQSIWEKRCRSAAETTEIIKKAITPETFFNAAFYAVETLGAECYSFVCLAADPVTKKFHSPDALNREFLLTISLYHRELYNSEQQAEKDKTFPLITRENLADPDFISKAQLPLSVINDEPAAACRFKAKRKSESVEQEFQVELCSYYPTLPE